MENNITQGDWQKMKATQLGVPFIIYVGNETIFQCYGEEAEGNTDLVLAAKGLLEACQKAYNLCDKLQMPTESEINELKSLLKVEIDKALPTRD